MGGGSLPSGTVTFLFTDIEGSTRLLQDLGDAYEGVLSEHRELLRKAFASHGGHEVGTEGDSFFVVFARASDGVAAALEGQLALGAHDWSAKPIRVRMGVHTGEAQLTGTDYVGLAVHQAARISSAAHGGQVLVSQTTKDLVGSTLPDGATFVDLGEHRLKDLAQPTRLYNLAHAGLQAELPPPRTLSVLPNNLPLQLTTFIGRDEEIAKVGKLLESTRLLTLSGAGGSGKTRLALQVAADLITDYRNGVWLADFAPITDPELVMRGIAEALGVREEKDRSIEDVLVEFLQGKELLVVVDNCEHLTEACAMACEQLLHAASELRVIATSRETLGAEGETVFRVPSLDTPKPDEPLEAVASYEAVRLFCDRAARSSAEFDLAPDNTRAVTEICRRLDGMPLAIELAAARIRMLTPQEIAKRLDDRFKLLTGGLRTGIRRQQTLRAAVDWSYEMLSDAERLLFRRLAVFVGGFTLEAAEGICAMDSIDEADIFDILSNLVDRSLVVAEPQHGTTRFRLLETMREYGREALAASGEAQTVWSRHLAWFADLAEGAVEGLGGAEESVWLVRLDAELDNFRQALSWATSEGGAVDGLRLAASLYRYWQLRWYVAEGFRWVQTLLDASGELPLGLRAKALMAAGSLVSNSGKPREGRPYFEECVSLERTPESARWVAEATNDLGIIAWMMDGDMDRTRKLLEEALELHRQIGHRQGVAESLNNLGAFASWQGDRARSRELIHEAVEIYRELGAQTHVAFMLGQLAAEASMNGEFDEAERLQNEALIIRRQLGDRQGIASSLNALGGFARALGDYDRARASHEEALEVCRAREDPFGVGESTYFLGLTALEEGNYGEARHLLEQSLARGRDIGAELYVAFSTDGLAAIDRAEGRLDEARSGTEEALATVRRVASAQVPVLLVRLGAILRAQGELDEAATIAREAIELAAQQDVPTWIANCHHLSGLIELSRGRLEEARSSFVHALAARSRLGLRPAIEQSLRAVGTLAAAFGRGERGAQLLGAAEELREALGTVIFPVDRPEHDEAVAEAKADLGVEAFEAAWASGREMSLDEAVALALEA